MNKCMNNIILINKQKCVSRETHFSIIDDTICFDSSHEIVSRETIGQNPKTYSISLYYYDQNVSRETFFLR